jgi:hypothetical protein
MGAAKFLLAVASVFLFGVAAGALAHHRDGGSFTIPIVLALLGVVAAVSAWKTHRMSQRPAKPE